MMMMTSWTYEIAGSMGRINASVAFRQIPGMCQRTTPRACMAWVGLSSASQYIFAINLPYRRPSFPSSPLLLFFAP